MNTLSLESLESRQLLAGDNEVNINDAGNNEEASAAGKLIGKFLDGGALGFSVAMLTQFPSTNSMVGNIIATTASLKLLSASLNHLFDENYTFSIGKGRTVNELGDDLAFTTFVANAVLNIAPAAIGIVKGWQSGTAIMKPLRDHLH